MSSPTPAEILAQWAAGNTNFGYMGTDGAVSATPTDYAGVKPMTNKQMAASIAGTDSYSQPLPGYAGGDYMAWLKTASQGKDLAGVIAGTGLTGLPNDAPASSVNPVSGISDKLIAFAKSSGIVVFGAILIIVAIAIPARSAST